MLQAGSRVLPTPVVGDDGDAGHRVAAPDSHLAQPADWADSCGPDASPLLAVYRPRQSSQHWGSGRAPSSPLLFPNLTSPVGTVPRSQPWECVPGVQSSPA